jgi:dihydroflavonol-4-reductase
VEDLDIKPNQKVMVTGATGYVAGWIVKELLEKGLTVHAPIRNIKDTKKFQHLVELEKNLLGSIKFFEADLLVEGGLASLKWRAFGCI